MSTQLSPRISIPLTALAPGGGGVSEEGLRRHSYDLILFPRYLECLRAPRVRIKVKDNHRGPLDLVAIYEDAELLECCKYAFLIADEEGVLTDSDDLYRAVHAAFSEQAEGRKYIGFRRYGRPPASPLIGVAMGYQKYGRGIYLDGDMLPTLLP